MDHHSEEGGRRQLSVKKGKAEALTGMARVEFVAQGVTGLKVGCVGNPRKSPRSRERKGNMELGRERDGRGLHAICVLGTPVTEGAA